MNTKIFQVLRWFHVAVFAGTAVGKLLDVHGFALVIGTYRFGLPDPLLFPLALVVCLLELAMALLLIMNLAPVRAALLCMTINSLYLLLALISLARGLELKNCGCFGVFWARPLTWQTPVEDLILVAISFAFFLSATKAKA